MGLRQDTSVEPEASPEPKAKQTHGQKPATETPPQSLLLSRRSPGFTLWESVALGREQGRSEGVGCGKQDGCQAAFPLSRGDQGLRKGSPVRGKESLYGDYHIQSLNHPIIHFTEGTRVKGFSSWETGVLQQLLWLVSSPRLDHLHGLYQVVMGVEPMGV